jgi:hypothetical protein
MLDQAKANGIDLQGYAIFADQTAALEAPLADGFPLAVRIACLWHILQKKRKAWKIVKAIWRSTSAEEQADLMEGLRDEFPIIHAKHEEDILASSPFGSLVCTTGYHVSSLVEVLNGVLLLARSEEVVSLSVNFISWSMGQINLIIDMIRPPALGRLFPRQEEIIAKLRAKVVRDDIMVAPRALIGRGRGFVVTCIATMQKSIVEIDTDGKSPICSCGKPEHTGHPCRCLVAAYDYCNESVERSFPEWAHEGALADALGPFLKILTPVADLTTEGNYLAREKASKQSGRPRHRRLKGQYENTASEIVCGVCGKIGHTAKKRGIEAHTPEAMAAWRARKERQNDNAGDV